MARRFIEFDASNIEYRICTQKFNYLEIKISVGGQVELTKYLHGYCKDSTKHPIRECKFTFNGGMNWYSTRSFNAESKAYSKGEDFRFGFNSGEETRENIKFSRDIGVLTWDSISANPYTCHRYIIRNEPTAVLDEFLCKFSQYIDMQINSPPPAINDLIEW